MAARPVRVAFRGLIFLPFLSACRTGPTAFRTGRRDGGRTRLFPFPVFFHTRPIIATECPGPFFSFRTVPAKRWAGPFFPCLCRFQDFADFQKTQGRMGRQGKDHGLPPAAPHCGEGCDDRAEEAEQGRTAGLSGPASRAGEKPLQKTNGFPCPFKQQESTRRCIPEISAGLSGPFST